MLDVLFRRNVDNDLCAMIVSYLRGRHVTLSEYGADCIRNVQMGLPQGSVLGPYLWSVLFDEALIQLENARLTALAYMDDLVVIIQADTIGPSKPSARSR